MRKTVYLAGAMGCYGTENPYPIKWRKEAIALFNLRSDGFKIIDPTEFYEYGRSKHNNEKEVMRFDLRSAINSDVLLVNLKDLDKSIGTSDEIFYAYLHNKPIIGFMKTDGSKLDEYESKKLLHPWKYEQIDRIETGYYALENAVNYIVDYYGVD